MSRAPGSCVDGSVNGEERELLAALQGGDALAFDRVYGLYRKRLYGYLVRMTRCRALAEDLLQETWLRLAVRARDLQADTDLGAWLFTVARNLFLSEVRRAMTGAGRLTVEALGQLKSGNATPFELASATQTQRRLEQALLGLPIDQREILVLVAVERLEPAQVAQVLGLRPEAARKRLERARAMLAARLNNEQACGQPARRTDARRESGADHA